ncbi:hypothetical protein ACJIZ3_019548 [Penstemon smallii]|uniref:Uncharacterized protein n=1 Tax=Penstemon smallii TaxID=265156 RepID=A0ABD3T283_9LAMI
MIVVTSDEWSAWTKYVESNPDAKGMHNKEIPTLKDIVVLFGKDRANGQGDTEANSTFETQMKARP